MVTKPTREHALRVLQSLKHDDEDIDRLARNIELLQSKGLDKLNARLTNARTRTKILDTLAEHDFAAHLLGILPDHVHVSYESEELDPPPDFTFELGGTSYWIQMKNSNKLEYENREDKLIRRIKASAHMIPEPRYFHLTLGPECTEEDFQDIVELLQNNAPSLEDGRSASVPSGRASVEFETPKSSDLTGLTLATSENSEMKNVTGLAQGQVYGALTNAVRAFSENSSEDRVNLVAMASDARSDIDIAEAVFGTEFENPGRSTWGRESDGFFDAPENRNRIVGLVTMRRSERGRLMGSQELLFYVNHHEEQLASRAASALSIQNCVRRNMRPAGSGTFEF